MKPTQTHTILVVDDDEAVLNALAVHLASLPYFVIPTGSPAEAIHILRTREVAVLLCDLDMNMPTIDGNVILAAGREANPDLVSILLTGKGDQEAIIKAINLGGIWKYIVKPWNRDELLSIVEEAVKRYERMRQPQEKLKKLAESAAARPSRRIAVSARQVDRHGMRRVGIPWQTGATIGTRYKLLKFLGGGGTGNVYMANDMLLDMPVAIKILLPEFSNDGEALAKLKAEAKIAMQLSHRYIVRLHNLQKAGDNYFIVMEYVQGQTWREILESCGRLALESVVQFVEVCSDALSYAHRHGVIHKDLKPENILLTEDGVLKIIDFGIACLAEKQRRTRRMEGTPTYMSPEQVRGEPVDARSDIWSLGLIVFELLKGRPVFPYDVEPSEILDVESTELFGLPEGIKFALERAIAPRREDRWESISAFATAFIDAASGVLHR